MSIWSTIWDTINPANQGVTEILKDKIDDAYALIKPEDVKPTCGYYDSLCQMVGIDSGWHSPEWFQSTVKFVNETTGISPNAASVALPVASTGIAVAGIWGTKKLLSKGKSNLGAELYEMFKDDVEAIKFFNQLAKDDVATLELFNNNPEVAKHFKEKAQSGGTVISHFRSVSPEKRAEKFGMIAKKFNIELATKAPVAKKKDVTKVEKKDAKDNVAPQTTTTTPVVEEKKENVLKVNL